MSGQNLPSERAMRKTQKMLLKNNLVGERIKLLFTSNSAQGTNGLQLRDTPFAYVKDIGAMVMDYLDRHDQ